MAIERDNMISIVIPLYNKEQQISQTLETVLNQSFQDFEVVLVDDGSTDESVGVVRQFTDPRIRLIQQKNAGVSAARNRGVAEAWGEFVAFLDADDLWHPDYLAMQMALVEKYPDCDVYATNYEFADSKGRVTPTILRRLPFEGEDGILANYFEVASLSHPPLWTSAVMVRKSAMEAIGGFPLGIKSGEDLLTWSRLACRGKIAYSKKVGAIYNLGEGYDLANQPPRRQDAGDPVGKELEKLYAQYPSEGLKRYIGHWHKMRASTAIRYFERWECLSESAKSLRWSASRKILPFFVMPFIPKAILKRLFLLHK